MATIVADLLSLRKTSETLFPTTEVSQGRVIPLLAGARVFPEAQPREWAPPASSSSEGLGTNSGVKVFGICTEPGARNGKEVHPGL